MNQVSKEYVNKVKMLFPVMGNSERQYLKNLKNSVEDCCENKEPDSMDLLYQEFGTPEDVVNSYFNSSDTDYIISRIKRTRFIKGVLGVILLIILAFFITLSAILWKEHKIIESQQIFFEETTME